jgi:hypothetical protein
MLAIDQANICRVLGIMAEQHDRCSNISVELSEYAEHRCIVEDARRQSIEDAPQAEPRLAGGTHLQMSIPRQRARALVRSLKESADELLHAARPMEPAYRQASAWRVIRRSGRYCASAFGSAPLGSNSTSSQLPSIDDAPAEPQKIMNSAIYMAITAQPRRAERCLILLFGRMVQSFAA